MAKCEADPDDLDFDQDGSDLECGGNHRRPMNAFLIFCKRHRSLVRERYPHLENRGVTKILGELWANLEKEKKESFTRLAKQYKEAYMKANPDFKWYKQPSPPSRTLVTRPTNQKLSRLELHPGEGPPSSPSSSTSSSASSVLSPCGITPGKLADESQLGGVSSLIVTSTTAPTTSTTTAATGPTPPPPPQAAANKSISKPPKKRYLENLENGTFRSQNNDTAATAASDTQSPTSSTNNFSTTITTTTTTTNSTTTTTTTTNDCSALLKLAEMCSKELVRDEPVKATTINGRSLVGNHSRHSPEIAVYAVANSSSISAPGPLVSSATSVITSARSSDVSAFNHNVPISTAPPLTPKKNRKPRSGSSGSSPMGKVVGSELVPVKDGPFKTMLAASELNELGPFRVDNPLDLSTVFKFHNQDLIERVVDDVYRDLLEPVPPKKFRNVLQEATVSEGAASHYQFMDVDGGVPEPHTPLFQQHQPPLNHQKGYQQEAAASSSSSSSSPRKSQRSCKGNLYEAFKSKGLLQTNSGKTRERKLSSGAAAASRKSSSGDSGLVESDSLSFGLAVGSGRRRTPSNSSESATSRKSDRDDCMKLMETSRSCTPFEEEDVEFIIRGSSNTEAGASLQRHHEHLADKDPKRRFKTGDFDLEERIAALPNCNVEALDRKKNHQRRQSPSSSSSYSQSLAAGQFRRCPPFVHPNELKREPEPADSVYDMASLSDGGSDKADSSSSESRGGDEKPVLVGSQKRKARKRSITHLEPTGNSHNLVVQANVPGNLLVTLADAAAGEEKNVPSTSNQLDSDSSIGSA